MVPTLRYILLTALRDWLFVGLFASLLVAVTVSIFLGGTALVEQQEMAVAYMAGSTRVVLLLGLILFVCFHVRRLFENREVELILSRPISRTGFVLSYWAGFAILSLLFIIPLILVIYFFLPVVKLAGLALWGLSITLEAFLVTAFSLCAALILRSAVTAVLASYGFYVIARLMGFLLFMIDKPSLFNQKGFYLYTEAGLYLLSMIVPRLDLYTDTKWLIYGLTGDIREWLFLPQSLLYIPLLLLMGIVDFRRKQF